MKGIGIFVLLLTAVGMITVFPSTAHATFPGKNGRIAFVQAGEIFSMNPDGGDMRQLTHLGPDLAASWPSWSSDGKQIVFNEGAAPPDGDSTGELWLMNADGSDQHLLFAEPGFKEQRPSFSPDGTKVVFARCNLAILDGDTCAIHTVRVDGTQLTLLTKFQIDTTERSPMFSPDGSKISFIRSDDVAAGFHGVTYVVNADGTNVRRITEPEPCFIRPDWSPDGTKLVAFAHFCNPQPEEIAVMNSDGSGSIRYLTHNGLDYFGGFHDRNPAFSPDGEFIVFERNAPDFSSSAIYVMKADGSERRAVALLSPKMKGAKKPITRDRNGRRKLTKIEEGGSVPRWGVAAE
jgi:Tol biopolymer transport system component